MRKFTASAFFVALAALGGGCMRMTESAAPSADVSADFRKIQGTWGIESFDNGTLDKRTPAEKARDLEEMQQVRFSFDGNRLYILENGREELFATFALDETQNPKVLALTRGRGNDVSSGTARGTYRGTAAGTFRGTTRGTQPVNGTAKPEPWNWIYKFEGDALVVALCRDDRKGQPTEFKPRADAPGAPGVVVITFKKMADAPSPGGGGRTTARYVTARGTAAGTYRGTSK